MDLKQAIIVRRDLPMSPGKLAAQVAHAAVGAVLKAVSPLNTLIHTWMDQGMTKVVLTVANEAELRDLLRIANDKGFPYFLVTDEGRTEVPAGSVTALAIGPGHIDSITGNLPLLKG